MKMTLMVLMQSFYRLIPYLAKSNIHRAYHTDTKILPKIYKDKYWGWV